eukprot:3563807-Alexandrium_andersonii.AAC.1
MPRIAGTTSGSRRDTHTARGICIVIRTAGPLHSWHRCPQTDEIWSSSGHGHIGVRGSELERTAVLVATS